MTIVYISNNLNKGTIFIDIQSIIAMTKNNYGRVYVSRTVLRILKRYIIEDQRKMDKRSQLVSRIVNALEVRGITYKELASRIGKRPSEIKKLLNGNHDFPAEILSRIENELAISFN